MTMLETFSGMPTRTDWREMFRRLLHRYSAYREKRRALAELRSLDPGILKDMGVDRSEAASIVFGGGGERRRAREAG